MPESQKNNQILDLLSQTIKKAFSQNSSASFSQAPDLNQREIIEFDGRMRVFGLEKFNGPCFISTVHFFKTSQDRDDNNALGAMIIYIKEDLADKIFRSFKIKDFDESDEESMKKGCAHVAQIISAQFIEELGASGLSNCISSPVQNYISNVPEGVLFFYDEKSYYEISLYLYKEKALVVDLTFALTA